MDNFNNLVDQEDLSDLSDAEDSTDDDTNSVFEVQKPLVLELHELATKDTPKPGAKTKKPKNKNKTNHRSQFSLSSDSVSDEVLAVPSVEGKEEFYDARDSYHGIPENQPATLPPVQQDKVTGQIPKVAGISPTGMSIATSAESTLGQLAAVLREPSSTISKPVTR